MNEWVVPALSITHFKGYLFKKIDVVSKNSQIRRFTSNSCYKCTQALLRVYVAIQVRYTFMSDI